MTASTVPSTTTTHEHWAEDIHKKIQALCKKYRHICQIEQSQSNGKSLNEDQQALLHSAPYVLADLDFFQKQLIRLKELSQLSQVRSSMDENEIQDYQTHLCISDGITIFCLDLKLAEAKLQEYTKELQSLPTMSTMNFADEGLPVCMGLFKLGSDVYMVGGHHLSREPGLWSLSSLHAIYNKYPVKCSSSKTYRVSLADDGRRMSLSECKNIGELNRPKSWPIVVVVDGKIHVIESVPPHLNLSRLNTMPSHEVLTNNDHDQSQVWIELSPTCVSRMPLFGGKSFHHHTWYHLSVGDRIYARGSLNNRFEVFDFQTCKWELLGYPNQGHGLYSIKHVGQLVSFGYGHCVGRFRHKESVNDTLYVVIAIGEVSYVSAAAYLVTSSGQVLCYQRLPLFFGRVSLLMNGIKGSVINVDAEGKTMCAVVEGWLNDFGLNSASFSQRILHISTFTVEEVCGAEALVSSLWAVRRDVDDIGKLPFALEKYFVNVVTKDRYAFKLSEDDMRVAGSRLSACFL